MVFILKWQLLKILKKKKPIFVNNMIFHNETGLIKIIKKKIAQHLTIKFTEGDERNALPID